MKTNCTFLLFIQFFFCLIQSGNAQETKLFNVWFNNPCVPTEINLRNIVNDAASYNWDFGNGQISTHSNPESIDYNSPGNYSINLDITTQAGQRFLSNVRVLEAIDHEFIGPVDFYTAIYDEQDNLLYVSEVTHQNPQVDIPHNTLLRNETYRLQLWDYEAIGADDYCGAFFFNAALDNQIVEIMIDDVPVRLEFTIEDAAPNYSYSSEIELIQPYITEAAGMLTVNAPLHTNTNLNQFTWYLDGVEIEDSDTQTIPVMGPGVYTAFVDVSAGCEGLSEPYPYQVTSTEELADENNYQVFPNPFRDEIWLELQQSQEVEVNLLDLTGKSVWVPWEKSGTQIHIATHSVAHGAYVLQILLEDGTMYNEKLMKY